MAAGNFQAEKYNLLSFVNNWQGGFRVPSFQRSYTWRLKQIGELWSDLMDSDPGYFIGNIVCLEPKGRGDRLLVVDGQQRLFTLSLMLRAVQEEYCILRDKVREGATNEIDEQLFYIKSHCYRRSPTTELIILPGRESLRDVYESVMRNGLTTFDKERIRELDQAQSVFVRNYRTIKDLVKKHVATGSDRGVDRLKNLLNRISSAVFIGIICDSDNDAYKIFEGLNATGIPLLVSDLVKNAVLQGVRNEPDKRRVESKWEELEQLFAESKLQKFSDFLRHQWISQNGYITKSNLFSAIKSHKINRKSAPEIIGYVSKLLSDAEIYVACKFQGFEDLLLGKRKIGETTMELIRDFRYLGVEQGYALVLAFINKFLTVDTYTTTQLNNDLEKLWLFSLRSSILSVNPSDYERKFAAHCKLFSQYKGGKAFNKMSQKFYIDLAKLIKDERGFSERIQELDYSSPRSMAFCVLHGMIRRSERGIHLLEPTLEHIVPQKPIKWGLDREDVLGFVDKIGNLTILYDQDNKELGNAPMKDKVDKVYARSPIKMNRDLKKIRKAFEDDPSTAVADRGKLLADMAAKIFRLT